MSIFYRKTALGTLGIEIIDSAIIRAGIAKTQIQNADEIHPLAQEAFTQLDEYLCGKRKSFDLTLAPHGTPFQLKIWNAIGNIPYGETASYSQIARQIDNPAALRATGNACNKNPIPFFIPCHRVTAKNGIGGYAYGIVMKKFLLDLEIRYS